MAGRSRMPNGCLTPQAYDFAPAGEAGAAVARHGGSSYSGGYEDDEHGFYGRRRAEGGRPLTPPSATPSAAQSGGSSPCCHGGGFGEDSSDGSIGRVSPVHGASEAHFPPLRGQPGAFGHSPPGVYGAWR